MPVQIRFKWIYLIVLVPTLTELMENGQFPSTPREWITDITVTVFLFAVVYVLNRQHNMLLTLSETDPLTGAYNRRKIYDDLHEFIPRTSRLNELLTLVSLDVDYFKQVNDDLGHAEGDRLLMEVTHIVMSNHRESTDYFYRLGGDEFALLMINRSQDDKPFVEQKVKQTIQALDNYLAAYQSGVSYGISYLEPGENYSDFMQRADLLMYKQKRKRHQSKA